MVDTDSACETPSWWQAPAMAWYKVSGKLSAEMNSVTTFTSPAAKLSYGVL